ncbi:MAG TPA: TonB-dependent receptor [Allosphingosinicella sp.]|nr:TonB-dependent receptor [Allosphingosinicella sp.]
MITIMFLLTAAAEPAPPVAPDAEIVVTGSREPVLRNEAAVSATVFDREEIEALDLPATSDLLRLVPGVTVATSGPRGAFTEVRIRGAEAKHSLLFVDGIRFNDPAAGNSARFELLTSDALSRIEVVRGPQSALWGSEALGGVIAIETADGFDRSGVAASGEYGSHDSGRASLHAAARAGELGLSGAAGWLSSEGIDSFGGGGERDGFDNRSASLKAVLRPSAATEAGLAGHYVEGESEFDGFDPLTGQLADTLDRTENRIFALRGWLSHRAGPWSVLLDASYLDSANRNLLGEAPQNSSFGDRLELGAQVSRTLILGRSEHRLTAAAEYGRENFRGRDTVFFGATNQDRSRELRALVAQWRAAWSDRIATDIAVRHDQFSAFADATTLRATVSFRPTQAWTLRAGYGEGISQPTFYDLFGFFPGLSFRGNPNLRPESSRGWEAGLRWGGASASLAVTAFAHNLVDENLLVFDAGGSTTINADGESRRRGIEIEAAYRPSEALLLQANYTWLDAEEQRTAGGLPVREARRPRHSANLIGTGTVGPLQFGATLAYVGERADTDFGAFPARPVTLGDYLLASLRVAWRLTPSIEAYGRMENAFGADYQDAFGYHTPGRTVYAGLRLRVGD